MREIRDREFPAAGGEQVYHFLQSTEKQTENERKYYEKILEKSQCYFYGSSSCSRTCRLRLSLIHILEDEYLDKNSVNFHAHMGYRMIGEFKKCGYKFDRWYNMVWMEYIIGEHQAHMTAPESFPQIRDRLKEKYGLE